MTERIILTMYSLEGEPEYHITQEYMEGEKTSIYRVYTFDGKGDRVMPPMYKGDSAAEAVVEIAYALGLEN